MSVGSAQDDLLVSKLPDKKEKTRKEGEGEELLFRFPQENPIRNMKSAPLRGVEV